MSADRPGLACVVGKHLFVDIYDAARGECAGGWCLWCGTAAFDGDRITDEGRAEGFHRLVSDVS